MSTASMDVEPLRLELGGREVGYKAVDTMTKSNVVKFPIFRASLQLESAPFLLDF